MHIRLIRTVYISMSFQVSKNFIKKYEISQKAQKKNSRYIFYSGSFADQIE